ncbi:MAG: iron-sulfur cluster assembly accessory protein [Chloroflexi bacterium]|nr:iron-sulfur cluster assembly accessory protein [Chloroflexota bacterium]
MLTMTEEAQTQLKSVLQKQGTPDAGLRVYVMPGGCSGYSYGMSLDANVDPDDTVVPFGNVKVLVDAFSATLLQGSEIDYEESLMGGGFQVRNPNAVKSCSCGQSFDTVAGGGAPKPCS